MQDFKAKMQKIGFLLGAPDAFLDLLGSLQHSPDALVVRRGLVNPSPRTPSLSTLRASFSPGPSTLRLSTPTWKFLATGLSSVGLYAL